MGKIKVQNPVVELDGDEMTRIIWALIKDKLIKPYLDIDLHYYDLSIEHRDATGDQVTIDAANAIQKYGVGVKCATITPDEARVEEFHLKKMWKSPNGTIRNILGGVIFREPIICRNMPRLVPGWTKPIIIGRHAYGDQYRATDFLVPAKGKLTMVFQPADGGAAVEHEVFDFPSAGVAMAMYNLDDSIRDFARASMNYALQRNYPLYLSTKNTILKAYDGRFKDLFQEVFDKSSRTIRRGRHHLRAPADRRHGGRVPQMVRRLCLGLQELRWRRAVRHGGARLWHARADDERAADARRQDGGSGGGARHGDAPLPRASEGQGRLRPIPSPRFYAWTRALKHRAKLDDNAALDRFADTLERVVVETIEAGFMTKDLALLVGDQQSWLSTEGFLDKVDGNLQKALA